MAGIARKVEWKGWIYGDGNGTLHDFEVAMSGEWLL